MFDRWIQLLRNALCVSKSLLELYSPNNWLLSPIEYGYLSGMEEASFLNYLIAITQFIAGFRGFYEGLKEIIPSFFTYMLLRDNRDVLRKTGIDQGLDAEFFIVEDFLSSSKRKALTGFMCGLWNIVCGGCFFILFANSLKLVELKVVIDALIVMNIAVMYFLWLTWTAYESAGRSKRNYMALASIINGTKGMKGIDLYENICTGPFCDSFDGLKASLPSVASCVESELPPIRELRTRNDLQDFVDAAFEVLEKGRKVFKKSSTISNLNAAAAVSAQKEMFELMFLVLNIVAFCGYSLGILSFYMPYRLSEELNWAHYAKLGLSDFTCDFWGNFAGDLAWTVEPFLVLFVFPVYTRGIVSEDNKKKKTE